MVEGIFRSILTLIMLMVHILPQVVFHRYGVKEKLGIDLLSLPGI